MQNSKFYGNLYFRQVHDGLEPEQYPLILTLSTENVYYVSQLGCLHVAISCLMMVVVVVVKVFAKGGEHGSPPPQHNQHSMETQKRSLLETVDLKTAIKGNS